MNQVPTESIAAHWPAVEAGLLEVLRRTQEHWTPTHVKQALYEGRASLFVDEDGFCILQRLPSAWTSEPYLNVWVMWFKPGKARARRKELVAWLDAMRESAKCEWWEFSSPRDGWIGLEPDVEKVRTIWRRK